MASITKSAKKAREALAESEAAGDPLPTIPLSLTSEQFLWVYRDQLKRSPRGWPGETEWCLSSTAGIRQLAPVVSSMRLKMREMEVSAIAQQDRILSSISIELVNSVLDRDGPANSDDESTVEAEEDARTCAVQDAVAESHERELSIEKSLEPDAEIKATAVVTLGDISAPAGSVRMTEAMRVAWRNYVHGCLLRCRLFENLVECFLSGSFSAQRKIATRAGPRKKPSPPKRAPTRRSRRRRRI